MSRFHPSVITKSTLMFDHKDKGHQLIPQRQNFAFGEHIKPYVIASGVRHHPDNWTSPAGKLNLFAWLNPTYLTDLQNGNAVLLLDQSLEGYHTPYLWQWFHESCTRYNIPPESIIYVTGNWDTDRNYTNWCDIQNITNRIKTIPYTHFEGYVRFIAEESKLYSNWKDNIKYKQSNIIKTYNCLQKRLRTHRIWFYGALFDANLLDCGLVSMNDYGTHVNAMDRKLPNNTLLQIARDKLPLEVYGKSNVEFDDRYYIDRIVDQVYKDSWVTVVSEPIFADSDDALFISEKTFKPIACMHPFIILGGKHSLRAIREMGYKTFSGFIDESYDELSTFERIDAIIKELKRIDMIEDKLSWFIGMKDIIEYNYQVFRNSGNQRPTASASIVNYCKGYFDV